MLTIVQILVVFLLLLILSFAVPDLHPLLYTFIFSYLLLHLLTTIVFPFVFMFVKIFDGLPEPFTKLLIGSAILFYISELLSKHMDEAGYGSLAALSHFAVKLAILTIWIQHTSTVIEFLTALIKK